VSVNERAAAAERAVIRRAAARERGALRRRRVTGGLVLLASLGAVLALWQRPDPFASREIVRAQIADADGLAAIGADVRVAGVPVGTVSGVQRRGDHAQLTLTVDPSAGVVHSDATVALRPRLMFEGTAYVDLSLGTPAAPALGNRSISLSHSSTYVPLDDAISVLNASTRPHVRTVVRSVAGILSGTAPAALRQTVARSPRLLSDTAAVARSAQGPSGTELGTAVAALGHDASAIAESAPALGQSVGRAARVAAALEIETGRPLGQALEQLPQTVTGMRSGAGAADAILARLHRLIPDLEPAARGLQPALAAVRPLLRRAVPVMGSLTEPEAQLRTAIAGARAGAAPALSAVAALAPTLGTFQDTLLSALEKPTDLGDPAYLAFLGLFAGGGGASRPFGVDGQGHFMRFGLRFLTGVGQPLAPCALLDKVSPSLGASLSKAGGCTP
jgi:phospholipid/cholesterol/gamma-HCH transport system substrate-binding protein